MKRTALLFLVLLSLGGVASVSLAEASPMADAGLDQTVTVDTAVQLDGTGTAHPAGDIESYQWRINTPDGRRTSPECPNCERTSFVPRTPGRYDVTLTVTDTDGTQESDTLYIYVNDAGPSVALDGPRTPTPTEPTEYVATAESPDAELAEIAWSIDDEIAAIRSLDGSKDSNDLRVAFPDSSTYRVQVVVVDTNGRTAYDELLVRPGEERAQSDDADWMDVDSTPTSSNCASASNSGDCPTGAAPSERTEAPPEPTLPPLEIESPESTPEPQPPRDEEIFYDTDGYADTLRAGSEIVDSSYLSQTTSAVGLDGGDNAPWETSLGEEIYEGTVGKASTFVFGQEQETVTCETTGGELNGCDEKIRQLEHEGGTTNAHSPSGGGAYQEYGLENAERVYGPDPTNLEDGQNAEVTVVVQEDQDNIIERGRDAIGAVEDAVSSGSGDDSTEDHRERDDTEPIVTGGSPSDDDSSESSSAASDLHSRLPETDDIGGDYSAEDTETSSQNDGGSEFSLPDDIGGGSNSAGSGRLNGIGGGLTR
jgi:hypothetical protein